MIGRVIVTEFMKLRRSVVPWVTLAVMLLVPAAIAMFIWIVQHPETAASLGLLGTKANLAGLEPTWAGYARYLGPVVGMAGLIVIGFIVAYLFGREYVDSTAKNMLALPVARGWFVLGKLVVTATWWAGLTLAAVANGLLMGWALDLPGRTPGTLASTAATTFASAGIALLVAPLAAWATIATRNYLGAIGFVVGTLMVGNLLSHTGWADWIPWSLAITTAGDPSTLSARSMLVLGLAAAGGCAGAVLQLRRQDNP